MGIKDRLARLEGGRGDRRCSCGFSIYVSGKFARARLHGVPVTEEEWRAYAANTNPDGTCHLCGLRLSPKIKIGGPEHAPREHHRGALWE